MMPWVRPEIGEQAVDYARRMISAGMLPFEVIKGLREHYELDLPSAFELVATTDEIDIFLEAQRRRGVSHDGVKRLLAKVYGMTSEGAAKLVEGTNGGSVG